MLNSIAALTRPHLPSPSVASLSHSGIGLFRALNLLFIHSPGVTTDVHYSDLDRLDGSVQTKDEIEFRLWKLIKLLQPYLTHFKPLKHRTTSNAESQHALDTIPITNPNPLPLLTPRPSPIAFHSSNPHFSSLPPNNQIHHFHLNNPPLPSPTTPRTPQMALAMPPMRPHLPPRHHAPLPRRRALLLRRRPCHQARSQNWAESHAEEQSLRERVRLPGLAELGRLEKGCRGAEGCC